MSRPHISYPTPVAQPGPSNYQTATPSASTSSQLDTTNLPRRSSLQVRQAGPSRPGPNALDSSITRLLVVTKQLLQGLEQWAQGFLTEENVSDIYVRLGDGFETCVGAFHRVGISTRELESIPADLRVCLEQCLAEDPCQESLNLYLPDIRQIIYNLLEGLKRRQAQYKRNMANAQAETEAQPRVSPQAEPYPPGGPNEAGGSSAQRPARNGPPLPVDARLSVRSASSNVSGASQGSGTNREAGGRGTSPHVRAGEIPMPGKVPSSTALAERERERAQRQASGQRPPAPPDAFRPPRRIPSESNPTTNAGTPGQRSTNPSPQPSSSLTISTAESVPSRGVQLTDNGPVPSPPPHGAHLSGSVSSRKGPTPPRPDRYSRDRDSFPGGRVSRFSADSDITNGSPVKSNPARSPPNHIQRLEEAEEPALPTGASTAFFSPTDAPALPRLELPSTEVSLNDNLLGVETGRPSQDQGGLMPDIPPESQRTLAALRGFDPLERRASKRYSSFTFNKMLPSSPNKRRDGAGSTSGSASSPQRPAIRRADSLLEKPPPMPPLPEMMRATESSASGLASARMTRGMNGDGSHTSLREDEEPLSPISDMSSSSMKILSTPESRPSNPELSISEDPSFSLSQHTPRASSDRSNQPPRSPSLTTATSVTLSDPVQPAEPPTPIATSLQVYLQLGRQVKRCRLETPVTFEGLRLLFMEKFEYDSGLDDFPDVYLRDPVSGVGYELEEMDDVKEGAVLSLNIEPLDQVKQHFDQTFAGLMAEVKEMKMALDHSRRLSLSTATALIASAHPQTSPATRNLLTSATIPSHATLPSPSKSPARLPSPRLDATGPALPIRREKLEEQHDSLLSLRRDLAVMRQIHTDFLSETKTAFSALRTQNNTMKEVIKTKIGGSRALLDNSKAKLEGQCSETIQAVEEIQDIIDAAREDAYKRFVTPSSAHMKKIRTELKKALSLADRFASDVATSEGTWRATWAQELSRVKEEQNLLAHQRKLGDDLKNDLKDAAEMWDNVEAFVMQRKGDMGSPGSGGMGAGMGTKTPTRIINFRPPTPDADLPGGGVNNLLMEIRTKEADPHTRLRAIEAQQRQREKERVEKSQEKDEFAGELEGFVNGRKLRKTGGTEEVERARQRRQELTLRKMLTGDQPPLSSQHTGGGRMVSASGSGSASGSAINSPGGNVLATPGVRSPATPVVGGKMTPQVTGGSIGSKILTPQITGSSVRSSSVGHSGGVGPGSRDSVEIVKEEEV